MPSSQNVLGKLTLNSHGHILKSSGDLVNDQHTADVVLKIVARLAAADRNSGSPEEAGDTARVSLHYNDHCLVVTNNNGNINVTKLSREPPAKRNGKDNEDSEAEAHETNE